MKKQLLNVALLLATAGVVNAQASFAPAVNYGGGITSWGVFSADFNGDGNMDLVTANVYANNLSVRLGNGTGTFATAVNYAVGTNPSSIFSADFNGDGKKDLATANFGSNNVSVLLGSGTGTFAAAVNYAVGTNAQSVFSTDFNGDGKKDLAVTNLGSNNVSILIGNGTGTFGAAVSYAVGTNPISVFSADFNGDGKPDLATANQSVNNVSVLLNSGTGTFAAAVNYPVANTPMSIFSADFNNDGRADLVTANDSYSSSVLLNNTPAASLNFDGTDDYVQLPDASINNLNAATIETWVYLNNNSTTQTICSKQHNFVGSYAILTVGMAGAGKVQFNASNSAPTFVSNATLNTGQWYHLAMVFSSTQAQLYVNGVLDNTMAGNFSIPNDLSASSAGGSAIGAWLGDGGGKYLNGIVDEFRIWNRALCKGEILNNKNKELSSTQTGLVAYFKFNQGGAAANNSSVTTLTDISGNANNGTLSNFALSGTTSNWVAPGAVTSGSMALTYTPVSVSVSSQTNVLCNGGSNGSAAITTTGGTSPYTYLASTGATVSTLSNLTAGAYTYTVTDVNTCKAIQTLTITQPSALVTNTAVSSVLCNGGNTGSATVTTTGGTSPYTYLVSTGATTSTLSNLTAGAYTYTVTDNNGCIKTQAFTITEPSALAAGTIINPILCNGANDGKLTAVGIQGTAPYTYSWSTGATTSTIVNVSPGVYTATVTDANGCVAVATKTVTEPSPVTITITASSSNICAGSSSTLTASASGGMGGTYTYTWVAGPTSSVSVVSPTTSTIYTISVEDGNSCVKSSTINIVANVCAQAEALNFDGSNDYVSLPTNPVSGDFTIEYWVKTTQTGGGPQWYGGIGMVDAEYPGVTNDFGTALVGNKFAFGIGNPDVTIVSSTNINDGTWHHVAGTWVMSTGAMSLYVDGVLESTGVGSTNPRNVPTRVTIGSMQTLFTYFNGEIDEVRIWNSARTQCEINTYKNCEIPADATNLAANYHFNQGNAAANNAGVVSLTDATSNNITGTLANFALNGTTSNWVAPGGVVSGYTATAPAPTVTVNSGSICAEQSFTMMPSGADTYIFSSGTDVVTPSVNETYTVIGTVAATGCSNTAVSSVTVNPLPSVTANSGNVTTCGDVSADFGIVATGNNNTYEWHFDQVGGSDHGVINGTYTEINFNTDTMTIQQVLTGQYAGYYVYCYVTNEFGCVTRTANDTIVANLTPTITVNSGAICAGQSFTIVPSGASTYTYSGGSDVVMPTTDASYTVTGTDANGCENTAVSSLTVNALPNLTTMTTNTLLCTGETTTLSVMGASTYTWSTTETTTDIAVSPTVQTTYTVEGTDANGCSNTTTITQDVSLCTGVATLSNDASINVYPNPNNGLFTIEVTTASKVTVTNALGQVVIAETFDVGKHSININNESTGVYFVKVMTNNKQQIIKVIKE